ncbi:molybdenum cofactor biosynthesis protein MoaE [Actinomyces radicidentis]|uniref:Molybdenum cofactor biosynthesis protein MoaE n=1 Tax=Actinomyces radicidentis TaxID=111015 RepID=A0A109W225_ACTRD|nr:molybdenum cofactor biosynthesis protein MoaE [Actinomyces radicidentis]AMD86478.1 molybdenum cofactor biosynthesis protein MoaE [Actinomyces radicidentis]
MSDQSAGGESARVVRAEVTSEPVSVAELAAAVEDRAAGAVLSFDGVVRDHDGGRGVIGLTYSSHPSADEIVRTIAQEVAARPGLRAVAVVHRVGDLRIGETALGVAVSADHRAPAFDALRETVEEVKKRLPIWKHQLFEDGSKEWSNIA